MAFLKNALMCILKKVKLINHDCLPILMPLYIMLAYLMLLAALSNAVCLHNAFFLFPLIFANAFCFHALSWFIDTVYLFQAYFASCTLHLICWFFLILCSHRFQDLKKIKVYVLSGEIAHKNNHYYYYSFSTFKHTIN